MIAIGNSGRQDDGLGWAFADAVKKDDLFKGKLFYAYQLNIEDADLITRTDTVIFVDASQEELENGFEFSPCQPSLDIEFTTHALRSESVVHLCNSLFNHFPKAYLLKIQGYEWELGEEMTKTAKNNLQKAVEYFRKEILK